MRKIIIIRVNEIKEGLYLIFWAEYCEKHFRSLNFYLFYKFLWKRVVGSFVKTSVRSHCLIRMIKVN